MSNNPYGAYLETKVLSASPLQLIHLAYEAAIAAIRDARVHLAGKRIRERSQAITKAQCIVNELKKSLDFHKGGEISVQLGRLYDYMQRRLIEANFRQIEEPMIEVEKLLETLDAAWKEIAGGVTPATTAEAISPWMAAASPAYSRADYTL